MTSFEIALTPPYAIGPALATLAVHTIPGAEVSDLQAGSHIRLLPGVAGPVAVTIRFAADHVTVSTTDAAADQAEITRTVRRWLDLDADPARVYGAMREDRTIGPLIRRRPGVRVIGSPDGFQAAVSTVLGQQVSLAAGRTFAGRLVAAYGTPGPGGLTRFPSAEILAAATPTELQSAVRVTGARGRTLHALAEACADGLSIDPDGDHADIRRRLLAVSGIGPWTVEYLAVRALGDRDAYPAGDLVLRRALGGATAAQAASASLAWSPYRAYALFQLWTEATYAVPVVERGVPRVE